MPRDFSWIIAAVFLLGSAGVVNAQAPAKVYPGPTPGARCGPDSKPEVPGDAVRSDRGGRDRRRFVPLAGTRPTSIKESASKDA